jgi:PIN domain nuclease of toxin-antitoxin system
VSARSVENHFAGFFLPNIVVRFGLRGGDAGCLRIRSNQKRPVFTFDFAIFQILSTMRGTLLRL